MKKVANPYLKGYLLLPPSSIGGYRGVDRNPFVPILLDDLIEEPIDERGPTGIWTFYPPGWRREAYRLYEEDIVQVSKAGLEILSSLETARTVKSLIEPHLGHHEIVFCEIWELQDALQCDGEERNHFLGYDIAYPGGDFYSAILNGLFINPNATLTTEYRKHLNVNGLFHTAELVPQYYCSFKEVVPSEQNSEFAIFRLSLM